MVELSSCILVCIDVVDIMQKINWVVEVEESRAELVALIRKRSRGR